MKRFYVQWHLLDRCNLRCRHCYQDGFSAKNELDWRGLERVARNLLKTMAAWNCRLEVALTGGEPLLKEEIFQLLDLLDRRSETCGLSIITNGTLLGRYAGELRRFKKLRDVRVSLDGADPEANDRIRGRGIFAEVWRNICAAKAARIPLILMATVMKGNVAEAARIVNLARTTELEGVIIERFFPLGRGVGLRKELLSGPEFLDLWREILDRQGLAVADAALLPYRGIKVVLRGKKSGVFGSGCILGRDGCAVMPDGSVFPCRRFPLRLGNLLEKSLAAIWEKSLVLAELRGKKNLGGKCRACGVASCRGCRAMAYCLSGDYLAEDPHCWL